MRIVRARPCDVATILQIERKIPTAPHWAESDYASIVRDEGKIVRRCLLVAWQGSNLTGFVVGNVVAAEAELESVAVHEVVRRSGIGRCLCAAAMTWAWKRGATAMGLEVRAASTGAIAMYAGLGFREVGRRPRYYSAPIDDAILMKMCRDVPC